MINQSDTGNLGSRIRSRLKQLGRSQGDLATHLGVKQSAVSQWMNGKTKPKQLNEIAAFLETTYDWLAHGRGEKESPLSASLGAISEAVPKSATGKSPLQEARALQNHIIDLCAALRPEAQLRFDVDSLASDLKEILGHTHEQPKDTLKKTRKLHTGV